MRVILVVIDSVGIGSLPDADKYGDGGSNTLGNIAKAMKGKLQLTNYQKLGMANIVDLDGISSIKEPLASYGKCAFLSNGKDTTTGHWEIIGLITEKPFPTYPQGFPSEIIEEFELKIGKKVIGNIAASGTEIIEKMGKEHEITGKPIVYTSADSVFQIAAHENIVSREKLYQWCQMARNILTPPHSVARVIARPFIGEEGNYIRTDGRRDFSLMPGRPNLLSNLADSEKEVLAVGKIKDIYLGEGIEKAYKSKNNREGMEITLNLINDGLGDLIFTNLVDFDMLYGHRNDVEGYANALMATDDWLEKVIKSCREDDVLIITADHGCDPTWPGTDHTREYVPVLVYGDKIKNGVDIGVRKTAADIGQTIACLLDVQALKVGEDFSKTILKGDADD